MMESRNRRYRFDDINIDVANLRITVGSETRPLEPKSFRLLLFLVENPGRALTKDEIMAAVWPDAAVSDNSLARAVTQIRKVLEDDPKAPKYIETVPTIGYRFLAEFKNQPGTPAVPEPGPASQFPRKRWGPIAAAFLAFGFLATGAAWWLRGRVAYSGATVQKNITFVQLTDQPGQELYPSLSPDGKSLAFAARVSGNWDVYSERVGGTFPVNLTKDSPLDDTQPAFSPDGQQIAFRSEREGGGIFVMGASGENVRRVTDFGFNPAWSPDGREIVVALAVAEPETRLSVQSQLFSVNVATGEKHAITPPSSNAFQPRWSPHGNRVAYWGQAGGRLDIWTIPARGGEALRVTDDAALNWNPVWSPDGSHIYFASNRGGSMNLWRVPINELSGRIVGEIEPVTTPSTYAAHISLSRSGQLAYVGRTVSTNIFRVGFDPVRETAIGRPMPVTQGSHIAGSPAPSPDGEQVAFVGGRGDIFVVRSDGSAMRQLTDDGFVDRIPNWSPDGKLIAFHSNRGGKFDIWTIHPDGSELRQLTFIAQGTLTHAVWSPDGKRLIYSVLDGTPSVVEVDEPWNSQAPRALPTLSEPGGWYEAASWSPDGRKLAGFQVNAGGKFTGIGIYSLETGEYVRISDFGQQPTWLKDSRRLIFTRGLGQDSAIYLADSQSRKIQQILSVAPNGVRVAAITQDNRWIYFSVEAEESDIWLANLP